MKKFLLILFLSFSAAIAMFAQQTPDEIIPLWQRRFVPPSNEVDSTFNSIVFKTEKDSFATMDLMNFRDGSNQYGSGNVDSMRVTFAVYQDDSSVSYPAVQFESLDVTGYPGFGLSPNMTTVNPASNNNYDPSLPITITLKFDVYTPSGGLGIDSLKITSYPATTAALGFSDTETLYLDNSNAWTTKTVTFTLDTPSGLNSQTVLFYFEPKFTAQSQVCAIANARLKISN